MANILIIDDEESIRTTLSSYLQAKGHRVMEAELGATGLGICRRESPDLVLLDMKLPDGDGIELLQQIRSENEFTVVIMITAFGTIEKAVRTLKLGAENFLTKPFDPEALLIVMEHALRNLSLRKQEVLQELTRKSEDENHFIGRSSRMLKFYELARIVSQDQITILIQGETGSGKGRWAQWIHDNGPRPSKAFVELNCAGLSKELLESELFGYEKGAFTGAVSNKVGLLEVASGGTLFLDEISEMELPVQAKMLKVLEEKKFRRLGAVQERRSDVRLITATNRNLETFVKDGKFREDLFYRLKVMTLDLPPLRERKEEIVPMAEFFLSQMAQQKARRAPILTDEARDALRNYHWPGNVRELRNLLERAFLLCQNNQITNDLLPFEKKTIFESLPSALLPLHDVEVNYMRHVLSSVNGNYSKAAEILGVNRNTLYNRLQKKAKAGAP